MSRAFWLIWIDMAYNHSSVCASVPIAGYGDGSGDYASPRLICGVRYFLLRRHAVSPQHRVYLVAPSARGGHGRRRYSAAATARVPPADAWLPVPGSTGLRGAGVQLGLWFGGFLRTAGQSGTPKTTITLATGRFRRPQRWLARRSAERPSKISLQNTPVVSGHAWG